MLFFHLQQFIIMHQEKYSLTWGTYSDHLKSMMKELMMNEDFSDVTLVTEDKKQIKANISVLNACSPVFREILKREKNINQILYLRDVQYSEMESIIQFIYLGKTTFHKERMDEFFTVAKSLEIKELYNAEPNYETELDDEPSPRDQVPSTKNSQEQTTKFDNITQQASKDKKGCVVCTNTKYNCDQCPNVFTQGKHLNGHEQSVYRGIKYYCDQCDYQAKHKSHLNDHIQSIHEGVKYACDQCDYQSNWRNQIRAHIQSIHEGVKYQVPS